MTDRNNATNAQAHLGAAIPCLHGRAHAAHEGNCDPEPWCGLLAGAAPRDHIVQLYQDQQFLVPGAGRRNDRPGAGSRSVSQSPMGGEMVNILWERGDVAASMNLEDLFDQLAAEQEIAIFCSFVMDNFNGDVQSRMLPRLGENHSHLIPVEDYVRLERAVAAALRETVGVDEAQVLEARLMQNHSKQFHMPRPLALLLALRQSLPVVADAVLSKSRTFSAQAAAR
jgi:hypothetical protein